MKVQILFLVTVFTLAMGGAAHAGTLTTGPLLPDFGTGSQVRCEAVNVGTIPVTITIDIINTNNGLVGETNTCSNVGPDHGCGTALASPFGGFCRITTTGSTKKIRGSLQTRTGGNVPTSAIEAR
ncbi:MAG TPA: hypothetical protein VFD92_02025 [Candidatus Binatia bacterium]|nr:hypothetical protein [Candidatus Binatia bacterium]